MSGSNTVRAHIYNDLSLASPKALSMGVTNIVIGKPIQFTIISTNTVSFIFIAYANIMLFPYTADE